jgi:hypothetical protein
LDNYSFSPDRSFFVKYLKAFGQKGAFAYTKKRSEIQIESMPDDYKIFWVKKTAGSLIPRKHNKGGTFLTLVLYSKLRQTHFDYSKDS